MATTIAQVIEQDGVLVAEAGTGTGKTFAYLVPALLSGKRVIISTGTRNLQDQLFHKDLPLVRKALQLPITTALLKGRGNYLCPHRLQLAQVGGRFQTRSEVSEVQKIKQWSVTTKVGDISECESVAENALVWSHVTSSADNCLGGECDFIQQCYLNQARRKAQEAELIVVNHHLFFADMALRTEGVGELLPAADCYIFDEAHQLPEVATNFFGTSITANQLLELAHDTINEDVREAGEDRRLRTTAEQLDKAIKDMRLTLGQELRRAPWQEIAAEPEVQQSLTQMGERLEELRAQLESQAERGQGLKSCFARAEGLQARLQQLEGKLPADHIHWFETHKRSFSLNLTPLHVGPQFQQQLQTRPRCSWVFTSATLSVGGSFHHFTQQLGLDAKAETHHWESPFDFSRQALLYIPEGLPAPQDAGFTRAVIEQALKVIAQSQGGAFILFTSHRALRQAAEMLEDRLDYPLLVQGEEPRSRLIERFRELGNAVLLGTGSFWEGVDVRGDALTCVVIDKLPFASPGDPILQARIDDMRRQGRNPFMEHQLPEAVISLKQGVGRLIRDVNDYGVLMICDSRLGSKPYGRIFLDSLPQMSKSRKLEVVERFYRHHRQSTIVK